MKPPRDLGVEPGIRPPGFFPIAAHVALFAAFGWLLSCVPEFRLVFDDLGAGLPMPTRIVMALIDVFASVGLPLWILALAGAAVDAGTCCFLCRKGLFREADLWLRLVAAGVISAIVALVICLFLPLVGSINPMK